MSDVARPLSFRERLMLGECLSLKKESKDDRIIPASWIEEAAAKSVRIDIRDAVIQGKLNLRGCTFEQDVVFLRCRFENRVNFAQSHFKRNLLVWNSVFQQGVVLDGATIEQDARLDAASFHRLASFKNVHIGGVLSGRRTVFDVRCDFSGMTLDKSALFWEARFEEGCDFGASRIAGSAEFSGAVFRGLTNFNPCKINLGLFFRSFQRPKRTKYIPAATFEGETDFAYVDIDVAVEFSDTRFNTNGKRITFRGAKFNGIALFDNTVFDSGETAIEFSEIVVGRKCDFTNATFESPVFFIHAAVSGAALFSGVEFKKTVDFNSAKIQGFAAFGRAKSSDPQKVRPAVFAGDAAFIAAQIDDAVDFLSAEFHGDASFNSVKIGRLATFGSRDEGSASFDKKVDFIAAEFGASAVFTNVKFRQTAAVVRFDRIRVRGNASFEDVKFGAGASFWGSEFSGYLAFDNAGFGSTPDGQLTDFRSMKVGGEANFRRAEFRGEAAFNDSQFTGSLNMQGALFQQKFSLNGTKIGGAAFFNMDGDRATRFMAPVDCIGVLIGSNAEFENARFEYGKSDSLNLPVEFDRAVIEGHAMFSSAFFAGDTSLRNCRFGADAWFELTNFTGRISFSGTRVARNMHFEHAVFNGEFSLRDTSCRSLYFDPNKPFIGAIDLRGCTYVELQGDWPSLFAGLKPYDRQPYNYLEKVYREANRDADADSVYLTRRKRETKETDRKNEPGKYLWNLFYRLVFNYGVRPFRLIAYCTLFLLIGIGTFSNNMAVMPATDKSEPYVYRFGDALALSLNQFLPVEIPMGKQWKPSEKQVRLRIWPIVSRELIWPSFRASVIATLFLKLPGWLFVPLGVAAFARLLRGGKS